MGIPADWGALKPENRTQLNAKYFSVMRDLERSQRRRNREAAALSCVDVELLLSCGCLVTLAAFARVIIVASTSGFGSAFINSAAEFVCFSSHNFVNTNYDSVVFVADVVLMQIK